MPYKVQTFEWNDNRYRAAKLLSEGTTTQQKIADEVGVNEKTLRRWKEHQEFRDYVDKLTLENELATRAGMLRELYKGAGIKADQVDGDKSTHLDYMKEIGNVQGFKTQKVEHSGELAISKIEITTSKREDAN